MAGDYDDAIGLLSLFDDADAVPSSDELEAEWIEYLTLSDQLLANAPADIAADLALSQRPNRALADAYAAAGWNYSALSQSPGSLGALGRLGDADVAAATERVGAWVDEHCAPGGSG